MPLPDDEQDRVQRLLDPELTPGRLAIEVMNNRVQGERRTALDHHAAGQSG